MASIARSGSPKPRGPGGSSGPSPARSGTSRFVLILLLLGATRLSTAFSYDEARAASVKACEAIDPAAYQSGLMFNPDGYRSYYVRSQCFQRAAEQFRDESLCGQVRQRHSLLASSWGYSPQQCRTLVRDGGAADRLALETMKRDYLAGPVWLRDFRVERNGNGRDIDIIPDMAGGYAHGYVIAFELLRPDPAGAVLIHSSGYHLGATSNLRIYIPQADIARRFAGFALGQTYPVRATVTLDVGFGGPAGYWSDGFIERVFPLRERSQSITRDVRL